MNKYLLPILSFFVLSSENTQSQFIPPAKSALVLAGIPFDSATSTGESFRARFRECETHNTCDGVAQRHGCRTDPSHNTVILKFPDGTIFFDAKLGLDADGSPISKTNGTGTDQPQTSFRFNVPGSPSVDADKIPFIVLPGGGFAAALGLQQGDIAAVIHDSVIVFALVADQGPKCKIGEGSIELHEELGHHVCTHRNARGECTRLRNVGIDRNVLYFVFPHSKINDLTPDNAKERIKEKGERLFNLLRTE